MDFTDVDLEEVASVFDTKDNFGKRYDPNIYIYFLIIIKLCISNITLS